MYALRIYIYIVINMWLSGYREPDRVDDGDGRINDSNLEDFDR